MIPQTPSYSARKKLVTLITIGLLGISQLSIAPIAFAQSNFDELQTKELNSETFNSVLGPKKSIAPSTGTTIAKDTFDGIVLNNPLPTTFFKNETYLIQGQLTNTSTSETHLFAFLNYVDTDNREQFINFDTPIINNTFTIPLRLTQTGNYNLGIIIGSTGKSKIREIYVADIITDTNNKARSTNAKNRMSLIYNPDLDQTSIKWKRSASDLNRVTFQQGTETVTYVTRQSISTLPLRFNDFKKFKPGEIIVTVATHGMTNPKSGSWFNLATQKLRITYHGYRDIQTDSITLPQRAPSVKTNFSPLLIQGTVKSTIDADAYLTLPNGTTKIVRIESPNVQTQDHTNPTIPANSPIKLSYTPQASGRYVIEINRTTGAAIVNIPVYVATGAPLIPDYQDLLEELTPVAHTTNLNKDRERMLSMINAVRAGLGLNTVTLSSDLNLIAQRHTDDMVTRNFFGHVNPSSESPEDRRKKVGFPTEVGENLANSQTLTSAMQGLLRSPIHRANILSNNWTQVGIGLATEKDGSIKVTQEFTTDALTSDKLNTLRSAILSSLNNERQQSQAANLAEDTTLSDLAKGWSQKLATNNEFGFKAADGSSLSAIVKAANLQRSVQMFVFSTNTAKDITSRIIEPSDVKNTQWLRIGLGLAVTKLGELKITLLLSK